MENNNNNFIEKQNFQLKQLFPYKVYIWMDLNYFLGSGAQGSVFRCFDEENKDK